MSDILNEQDNLNRIAYAPPCVHWEDYHTYSPLRWVVTLKWMPHEGYSRRIWQSLRQPRKSHVAALRVSGRFMTLEVLVACTMQLSITLRDLPIHSVLTG